MSDVIPTRTETYRDKVMFGRGVIMGAGFVWIAWFLVEQFT